MILTTEELSRRRSRPPARSITRPEILAKALLAGGTEDQKQTWLPKLASGEIMAAISVTEPDTGSDVASLACRAEQAPTAAGLITGAKAWCTFAGRADVIALLARTGDAGPAREGPDAVRRRQAAVRRPRVRGRRSPAAARSRARPIARPAIAACTRSALAFDRWLRARRAPRRRRGGLGRGFALQMAGFAAGRLQTGGRACGVTHGRARADRQLRRGAQASSASRSATTA